jgi:hypothetical protein
LPKHNLEIFYQSISCIYILQLPVAINYYWLHMLFCIFSLHYEA